MWVCWRSGCWWGREAPPASFPSRALEQLRDNGDPAYSVGYHAGCALTNVGGLGIAEAANFSTFSELFMVKKVSKANDPNTGMEAWPNVIRAVETPLGLLALIAIIVCVVVTTFVLKGTNSSAVYVALCILFLLVGVVAYVAVKNPHVLDGTDARDKRDGSGDAAPYPHDAPARSSGLKSRNELPFLPEKAADASEIFIAAISAVSIIAPLSHFWETSLNRGCTLRILLLNPASPAISTWESMGRFPFAEVDINRSLNNLGEIRRQVAEKGIGGARCEIRLSDTYLPCSLIIVDPTQETGWAIVEYHAYKTALGERPHIVLRCDSDRHWFQFYRSQFEKLWEASTEWNPSLPS
jgi:Domain of unknown function (DUF5919)